MIIWINGAFGVGKTSVANVLHQRIAGSFLYDPENAGNFIRNNLPESMWEDDFQDYPLWRELNYQMLHKIALAYPKPIIVPMTIVNAMYYEETIARLQKDTIDVRHFVLRASEDTLMQRLLGRNEKPGGWCFQQVSRCVAAFEKDICGIPICTENKGVEDIATEILHQSSYCFFS